MKGVSVKKLKAYDIEDILPLSPMQKSMLLYHMINPQSPIYFEQTIIRIYGDLEPDKFTCAIDTVIQANEMLRVVFRWKKISEPIQIILKNTSASVNYIDLSTALSGDTDLENLINHERRSVDLERQPLRYALCKYDDKKYKFIISNHHIIMDGWSSAQMLKEILSVYHELANNSNHHFILNKNKISSFIKYLKEYDTQEHEEFWLNELVNYQPVKSKVSLSSNLVNSSTYNYIIPKDLVVAIRNFSRKQMVTSACLFYFAWGLLLKQYSDKDDVVFGITTSGREAPIEGINTMIGLFINTIPLRLNFLESSSWLESIRLLNDKLSDCQQHQYMHLSEISRLCEVPHDSVLFDSILVIQNYPLESLYDGLELELEKTDYFAGTNLLLSISNFRQLEIEMNYNNDSYNDYLIATMMSDYIKILSQVVNEGGK